MKFILFICERNLPIDNVGFGSECCFFFLYSIVISDFLPSKLRLCFFLPFAFQSVTKIITIRKTNTNKKQYIKTTPSRMNTQNKKCRTTVYFLDTINTFISYPTHIKLNKHNTN